MIKYGHSRIIQFANLFASSTAQLLQLFPILCFLRVVLSDGIVIATKFLSMFKIEMKIAVLTMTTQVWYNERVI